LQRQALHSAAALLSTAEQQLHRLQHALQQEEHSESSAAAVVPQQWCSCMQLLLIKQQFAKACRCASRVFVSCCCCWRSVPKATICHISTTWPQLFFCGTSVWHEGRGACICIA
jgi:hypothetical protein